MKRLKNYLAVLLAAAIFMASGTHEVLAKQADLVVVLDAGHGGYDGGASGNGLMEKLLTLKIAQYCKTELEKYSGVKVYLTRTSDVFVGLDRRVAIAAEAKADIFVSIHLNSAGTPIASGAEVFYPNSNYRPSLSAQGRRAADAIQRNLVSLGLRNRGTKTFNSMIGSTYPDGSLADYYAVIRGAKQAGFPGIIVEHAFLSNASDASAYLGRDSALQKLGAADAQGIAFCYGLKKSGDGKEKLGKTSLTQVIGKSSSCVSLTWQKVRGAGGYEIYRSSGKSGGYQQIGSVKKAGTVTYLDKTAEGGKTYFYKVRPYKMADGVKLTGGYSGAQKIKLLKKPKAAVQKQSVSRAKVSWKEVGGASKYEIFRSTQRDGSYQKIAVIQDATSYKDAKRRPGQAYYYKVRAVGGGMMGVAYSSYSDIE